MPNRLLDAIDATWAPLSTQQTGPWLIRDGGGGGKRVSATSAVTTPSKDQVLDVMHMPLFMIKPDDLLLDQMLQEQGYKIIDPVDIFAMRTKQTDQNYETHDVPTEHQKAIWAEGGIGSSRLNVMARTNAPKTHLSVPHATAFIAIHNTIAMVHAVEVSTKARRQGKGRQIMHSALDWASKNGAQTLALAVTTANTPAQSLYHALGMTIETHYHYRIKE